MVLQKLADLLHAAIHPDFPQWINMDSKAFQVGMDTGRFGWFSLFGHGSS